MSNSINRVAATLPELDESIIKWGLNIKVIPLAGEWTKDQAITHAKEVHPTAIGFEVYYQDSSKVGCLVGAEREGMPGY